MCVVDDEIEHRFGVGWIAITSLCTGIWLVMMVDRPPQAERFFALPEVSQRRVPFFWGPRLSSSAQDGGTFTPAHGSRCAGGIVRHCGTNHPGRSLPEATHLYGPLIPIRSLFFLSAVEGHKSVSAGNRRIHAPVTGALCTVVTPNTTKARPVTRPAATSRASAIGKVVAIRSIRRQRSMTPP